MPVAKSLHKVSKKVAGSEKSVHPRGRKFKQLNKATLRQAKLAKHKAVRTNAKEAEYLPDLTDKENVERLLKWDGGIGGIIQVNMIRVTEQPSTATQKTDTEMQE
ncbi:hypothetical protein D0Z00_003800 [Geotrichum galactomycetum]|uniref:Uncharacterized protein n=1 Tax=Geotrichum galactomycetum TaxID=27317 RepID=A0ACB6V0E0_9ASCO|nr:hypothetical protein D0Z00_003800 [Geotrichum candidum]